MKYNLLKDVAKLVRGVSYKPADLHEGLDQNSIVLLKNNNINNDGTISLDDVVFVDKKNVSEEQILRHGDIIVCASGSDTLVGKAAQFYLDGEYTFGAFCKVVRPNKAYADYLGCFFMSPRYRRTMTAMAPGAIMKNLRNEYLLDLKINEHNEKIRQELSKKIKLIQSILHLRNKQLEKLDELLYSTYQEMFEFDNNKWPLVHISDICNDMRTGPFGSALHHDEFVDEGVFVLGIDNAVENKFSYNRMRYITAEKYKQLKRYTVYPGDVIITIMGTIGRSAVIPNDIPLAINTKHLACLTPNDKIVNAYFLCNAFQIDKDIKKQLKKQLKGAIMDGLNLSIIKKLTLQLPPIDLQNKFENIYNNIQLLKLEIDKDKKKVEDLQSSLMQEYFE